MEKVTGIINGVKVNGIPTNALDKKYIAAIEADGLWFWGAYDSYIEAVSAYDEGATDVILNPSVKGDEEKYEYTFWIEDVEFATEYEFIGYFDSHEEKDRFIQDNLAVGNTVTTKAYRIVPTKDTPYYRHP